MDEQYEKLNKEMENIKKRQTNSGAEEYNNSNKKNSIETFNNILDHAEERISKLRGRSFEISQVGE